jgi:putative hydrolase of the HAD superfamily
MIKGLFFDLFGTLLVYGNMDRAWDDWLSALRDSLIELGLAFDRNVLARTCDGFFSRPEPPGLRDGLTVYERRLEALFADLGCSLSRRQLVRVAARTVASWQRHINLDPEAIPMLEVARRRFRLALVSNFDHPPHVQRTLVTTGLAPFFERIVISGDIGVKKPDPGIFTPALERLGLAPSEVAHVGDSEEDLQGALAASLTPIMIRRATSSRSAPELDFRVSRPDRCADPPGTEHCVQRLAHVMSLEVLRAGASPMGSSASR